MDQIVRESQPEPKNFDVWGRSVKFAFRLHSPVANWPVGIIFEKPVRVTAFTKRQILWIKHVHFCQCATGLSRFPKNLIKRTRILKFCWVFLSFRIIRIINSLAVYLVTDLKNIFSYKLLLYKAFCARKHAPIYVRKRPIAKCKLWGNL